MPRDAFLIVAAATALSLAAFLLAARLGSWMLWLCAYGIVVLALIVALAEGGEAVPGPTAPAPVVAEDSARADSLSATGMEGAP